MEKSLRCEALTLIAGWTAIDVGDAILLCVRGRPLLVASGHGVDDDFGVTLCRVYEGKRGDFCGAEDAKLDGLAVCGGNGGGKGEIVDPSYEGRHHGALLWSVWLGPFDGDHEQEEASRSMHGAIASR